MVVIVVSKEVYKMPFAVCFESSSNDPSHSLYSNYSPIESSTPFEQSQS